MRKSHHGISAIALAMMLVACGGGRAQRFHDSQMDFAALQSVAVLPFHNLSRDTAAGDRVRDVLANMLLASEAFYVVPHGEVIRGVARTGVLAPTTPSTDDVVKLGKQLQVGAVITGTVKEYGEVRSGTNTANVVSISAQMIETETGKVVWSASSTEGGVTLAMWLVGSGGPPLNEVTEKAARALVQQLFH